MGDGTLMTVAAIRLGQGAAVVMMLTRQANGLATAASYSTAAPALPSKVQSYDVTHEMKHIYARTDFGMHIDLCHLLSKTSPKNQKNAYRHFQNPR